MNTKNTPYGLLYIGGQQQVFEHTAAILSDCQEKKASSFTVGLSGGSTPKTFYRWVVERRALSKNVLGNTYWLASDERCVPLESDDSNFGNAERLLLDPLGVPNEYKISWPTQLDPSSAARTFNKTWNERFGAENCFDLCFLGLGDDCHTASIFPGSPLIDSAGDENFAAVEAPDKSWRLTITEAGLARCGKIVVTVLGQSKSRALKQVIETPCLPLERPAQLLQKHAQRVLWLTDPPAAEFFSTLLK